MSLIREERLEDAEAIHAVLVAAFGREAEARLVERLRASRRIVCAMVAEEKGRVLGHVFFSRIAVESGDSEIPVLALAPLAALPAFQRLGIGSALVSAGLSRCRELGHTRVIVIGDAVFYGRFGFTRRPPGDATGSTTWVLEVAAYQPRTTFLEEVAT